MDNKEIEQQKAELDAVRALRNWCIEFATGKSHPYSEYEDIRGRLLTYHPRVAVFLPDWLLDCTYGSNFWAHIKRFNGYAGRKSFLNKEFDKIENGIKLGFTLNVETSLLPKLDSLSNTQILHYWKKCIERKNNDPEGVITASRAMVETTLKHILDERGVEYKKDDIMTLYKLVAKELNLSPSGHSEEIVKKILSGCISIIDGISAFRNEFSDAHGKSITHKVPLDVHSDFILNISGGLSLFLLELSNKD
jgi:hypothetical protein